MLEAAADPERGAVERRQRRDVTVVEHDPAAIEALQAADPVEQRRLAGAVGTDEPDDGALRDN